MSDPIDKPISDTDAIYADLGPPNYQRIANSKQLQAEAVQRQQHREHQELIAVLKTEAGQAVVMRLLAYCGVYRTTLQDQAAEGRRQVGLWLIDAIASADPEMYPVLLQEHLERQRRHKAADAAIAENHRRKAGVVRRVVTSARDHIRSAAAHIADRVW